jgi:hypothetical protein
VQPRLYRIVEKARACQVSPIYSRYEWHLVNDVGLKAAPPEGRPAELSLPHEVLWVYSLLRVPALNNRRLSEKLACHPFCKNYKTVATLFFPRLRAL